MVDSNRQSLLHPLAQVDPKFGQVHIQHKVEFFFREVLVVRQQGGKQPSPLVSDGELFHELGSQIIVPEDGISTPLKDPKHTHAIFGGQCAVEGVERVGEHVTVLIVPIDPRPSAIKMLPRRAFETCL